MRDRVHNAGSEVCGVNMPNDDAARFALTREDRDVEVIARFTVVGEPVSKARARFTSYGSRTRAYTPEKTKVGEQRVAWAFRQAAPKHLADKESTYGVMALFFHGTRQRRDVDNMLKLICDGLNGVAWADDVQVCEVSARRGYDRPENARTEVCVYRVGGITRPQATCEQCGALYDTYASWSKNRKFCSRECAAAHRTARYQFVCQYCSEPFIDRTGSAKGRKYCGVNCAAKARAAKAALRRAERIGEPVPKGQPLSVVLTIHDLSNEGETK